MIIRETEDYALIRSIFCEPEIYDRIADDGSPKVEDFEPIQPCEAVYYLTNDDNNALLFLHWKNCATLEGHIQILKEHRGCAMEFGELALKWIWENTEALKITVTIPDLYKDVLGFIKKQGFKDEGICTKSYLKNGILYDQIYLGLER